MNEIMASIPFAFFTALTLYWWKKHHCFDVCVYMAGLYAFCTFCGMLMVYFDMMGVGVQYDNFDLELNILPTVIFCFVIFLGLFPFSLIYRNEIEEIENPCPRFLTALGYFLIIVSFISLYLVYDSTADILNGNLEAVRKAHYEGLASPAELKAETLPYALRMAYAFNTATLLALPLFFYNVSFRHGTWWYNILLFLASLSVPVNAIQAADRTEFVYYGMMLLLCLFLFWKKLSKGFKRNLFLVGGPLAALVITYLTAVTMARFEDRDSDGAFGSALSYAGQNYLNFCYIWEKADFSELAWERVAPLTSHAVLKKDNTLLRRQERSGKQGFFISIFATYAGDVMLDLSPVGLAVWGLLYFMVCVLVIKRPHRRSLHIGEFLALFTLAAIPTFGVFYYRYMSRYYSYMILVVVLVYIVAEWCIKVERIRENLICDELHQAEEDI